MNVPIPINELVNYYQFFIAALFAIILTVLIWIMLSNRTDTKVNFQNVWKFTNYVANYASRSANTITIRIQNNTYETMGMATVTLAMRINPKILCFTDNAPYKTVATCCTRWPALELPPTRECPLPIDVRNARALIAKIDAPEEEKEISVISIEEELDGLTRFKVKSPLPFDDENLLLTLSFDSLNVFTALGERRPYDRRRLIIDIYPKVNNYSNTVVLDFPDDISLRGRTDNSEYYSTSVGHEAGRQSNLAFVGEPHVSMRYTFGTDDAVTLASPAIPFFYAGFSLLAAGFSLHLLNRPVNVDVATRAISNVQLGQLQFLGGLSFLISTTTTILEVARSRRFFFATSVTGHGSWDNWALFFCALTQFLMVGLVAFTLGWRPEWSATVESVALGMGIGLLGVWAVCVALLFFGFLQGYICDGCEHKLWRRVFMSVDAENPKWWERVYRRFNKDKPRAASDDRRLALCPECQRRASGLDSSLPTQ